MLVVSLSQWLSAYTDIVSCAEKGPDYFFYHASLSLVAAHYQPRNNCGRSKSIYISSAPSLLNCLCDRRLVALVLFQFGMCVAWLLALLKTRVSWHLH
jgi:hypothetical protein